MALQSTCRGRNAGGLSERAGRLRHRVVLHFLLPVLGARKLLPRWDGSGSGRMPIGGHLPTSGPSLARHLPERGRSLRQCVLSSRHHLQRKLLHSGDSLSQGLQRWTPLRREPSLRCGKLAIAPGAARLFATDVDTRTNRANLRIHAPTGTLLRTERFDISAGAILTLADGRVRYSDGERLITLSHPWR